MNVGSLREWLDHVTRDLDAAWSCSHGERPVYDRAAFHIQQAAEKLVKAAPISAGVGPPRIHDIRARVERPPPDFPDRARHGPPSRFSAYAVAFRYPPGEGDLEPVPSRSQVETWIGELAGLRRAFEARLPSGPQTPPPSEPDRGQSNPD